MTDLIVDYALEEGDVFDLSDVFDTESAAAPTAEDVGEFVRVVEGGEGAVDALQVNFDGAASGEWTTVAHFDASNGVKILFNDSETGASTEVTLSSGSTTV